MNQSASSWRRGIGVIVVATVILGGVAVARPYLLGFYFERKYWAVVAALEKRESRSVRLDPAFHKLPPPHALLADGKWATTGHGDFLLKLRRDYPGDAALLDYYRACWDFWNKNYRDAERVFRAQDREVELVRTVAARGERGPLEDLAHSAHSHEARAQAWLELGQPLQALAHSGRKEIWDTVRARVGKDISHDEYAGALKELAMRTRSGDVAEQIALELGKLKVIR